MPRRAPQRITAWSYSRLNTYQLCPAKLKYSAIDRIPIKENDAMKRGQDIHKEAEAFVLGKIRKMPESLQLFDEEFKDIRRIMKDKKTYDVMTEQQWAFREDWTETSWFGKDCWVRIVVDLAILNKKDGVLTIIDHKTGKARPDHQEQLKIYGTGGFSKFPGISTVNAEMWYLDQGFINNEENETTTFEADEHDDLIKFWAKQAKPLLSDTQFAPRPNNLCSWCDYSTANGGPCKY